MYGLKELRLEYFMGKKPRQGYHCTDSTVSVVSDKNPKRTYYSHLTR